MPYREQIPIDKGIDNTIFFLLEGYRYISNRTKRYNRDMFETRLLGGKKAVCMVGKEAAKVFYDEEKFKRQGAAPNRVLETLFGKGGVQTLDDNMHRKRKELFMSIMTAERLRAIAGMVEEEWTTALKKWVNRDRVVLYDEAWEIMTRAACRWAGVPLFVNEIREKTKLLGSLFEAGGAVGARHWLGRIGRNRAEEWMERLIVHVRSGILNPPEASALYSISMYRDLDGKRLTPKIAAVELLNILRPIVAISVYITFGALALYEHPEMKKKLRSGTDADYRMFVQEVRRFYPFFPVAVAKVRNDFLWQGHDFKRNTLVLLDLYGTNHHPNNWEKPNEFIPERFKDWKGNLFDFIPQGGGDYYNNHRCPGEWLTIDVLKVSIDMLVNRMEYDIPKQNLDFSMRRFPSLPKSRFIMTNVQSL